MLVLLFVDLWLILRGDLFYVLPRVILFLCFSVLLAFQLPRLGKRVLILVLFVHLFDLCLFGFVGFLFLLVSGKGCGLWLWHSLDFSLIFFSPIRKMVRSISFSFITHSTWNSAIVIRHEKWCFRGIREQSRSRSASEAIQLGQGFYPTGVFYSTQQFYKRDQVLDHVQKIPFSIVWPAYIHRQK